MKHENELEQNVGLPYINEIVKDYQREGIYKMYAWKRAYQADDMGLGKTLQTLTSIELNLEIKGLNIIVCPKFALGVWATEIKKWFGKESLIFSGTPTQRKKLWKTFLSGDYEYLITNFAMLSEIGSLCGIDHKATPTPTWYEGHRPKRCIKSLVVDEAHFSGIFNPKTKFYKVAHRVFKDAQLKYILTGTPMRQGCVDFYGPLSCLDPIRFNSYWKFVQQWCVVIETPFGKSIERNPANIAAFRAMLTEYMIRRKKEEVLTELPGKQRQLLSVALSKQQKRIYEELEEELLALIPETGELILTPTMMSKILRQRQVLASPQLLGGTDVGSGVTAIVEHSHLRLDEGVPVVVFTAFRALIPILQKAFQKEYTNVSEGGPIPVFVIQGGLTAEEFTNTWQAFQNGKGPRVLLVIIKSGASFQATAADTAYFIAPEWDATVNVQAEDRLNRIGQTNFVNIFYVDYDTSVDRRIRDLLNSKTESAELIAGTEADYLRAIRNRSI